MESFSIEETRFSDGQIGPAEKGEESEEEGTEEEAKNAETP